MMATEIALRAPLEDCTRVTLHESNVVRSGKPSEATTSGKQSQQQQPTLKRAASYDGVTPLRRTHNPYVNVIPEDPEQALLEIQAAQFAQLAMEQQQRRYNAAVAAAAAAAAATAPVTPTTPYFGSPYASAAMFDDMHAMSASMPTSPLVSLSVPPPPPQPQLTVGGRVPSHSAAATSSAPSSPSFAVPSAALTKVYQNGRPVPTLKRVASVEQISSPAAYSQPASPLAAVPVVGVAAHQHQHQQHHQQQHLSTPPRHMASNAAASAGDDVVITSPCTVTVQFRHPAHVARFNLSSPQKVLKVDTRSAMLGMYVIVDGDRGYDLGSIIAVEVRDEAAAAAAAAAAAQSTNSPSSTGKRRHHHAAADENAVPEAQIQRPAAPEEIARFESTQPSDEQRALHFASNQAAKLLPEKLCIDAVTFQFDRQKLTLWYRAPERVYFVPLLKVLNQQYKCRIWMEKLGE